MSESEPLVGIYFSFGIHMPSEVPLIHTKVQTEATNFFREDADNIYLREDSTASLSYLNKVRNLYRETGSYFDAYLQAKALADPDLGRKLNSLGLAIMRTAVLDVEAAKRSRNQNDLFAVFGYNELMMLDRISQVRQFSFETESFSDKEANRLKDREEEKGRLVKAAADIALKGDFDKAVKLHHQAMELQADGFKFRNVNYMRMLLEKVKLAQRNRRTTRVFVRVGAVHDVLAQRLLDLNLENTQVVPSYDHGRLYLLPSDRMTLLLEEDSKARVTKRQKEEEFMGTMLDSVLVNAESLSVPDRYDLVNEVLAETRPVDWEAYVHSLPNKGIAEATIDFIRPYIS